MARSRWIKLYAEITDNWIWTADSFSRGQAWIDLLLKAQYKDTSVSYNGRPLALKKGQLLTSVRTLSKQWGWGKDKTLKFLKDMESEGMILRDMQTVNATVLTIVKYDDFQSRTDTHKDSDKDTHKDTHKDTDPPHTRNIDIKNKENNTFNGVDSDNKNYGEVWN